MRNPITHTHTLEWAAGFLQARVPDFASQEGPHRRLALAAQHHHLLTVFDALTGHRGIVFGPYDQGSPWHYRCNNAQMAQEIHGLLEPYFVTGSPSDTIEPIGPEPAGQGGHEPATPELTSLLD